MVKVHDDCLFPNQNIVLVKLPMTDLAFSPRNIPAFFPNLFSLLIKHFKAFDVPLFKVAFFILLPNEGVDPFNFTIIFFKFFGNMRMYWKLCFLDIICFQFLM